MAAEAPIKVGFLGPEGTYTHSAALKHFGASVTALPQTTIDDVFHAVETSETDYGVVPVENSIEGMISHTLDSFFTSPLKICGEILLRIRHQLLSPAESIGEVQRVVSHAQSLAQCRRWLAQHLPDVELSSVSSNAEAVRQIRGDQHAAAIASEAAGVLYEVPILRANIEDDAANTTRFLVIGAGDTPPSGQDKTSLMVSNPNKPGALHRILSPLAEQNVSMTRIESRPSSALGVRVFHRCRGPHRGRQRAHRARPARSRGGLPEIAGLLPAGRAVSGLLRRSAPMGRKGLSATDAPQSLSSVRHDDCVFKGLPRFDPLTPTLSRRERELAGQQDNGVRAL